MLLGILSLYQVPFIFSVITLLGQVEGYDQSAMTRDFAAERSDYMSWWTSAILAWGFLCYTVGLVAITAQLTKWYLSVPSKSEATQGIGTDLVRLTAYWDMDLAALREEASRRGFLGTSHVTKKSFVRWLIENDHPWLKCV